MVPHRSVKLVLAAATLAAFLGLTPWAGGAVGATCDTSWASAASGFWDVAGNWTAGVPDGTKNACITLSGTYTITVRGSRSAAGITLGGSSGQQTLQLVGDATNGSAALTLPSQGSASDGVLANGRMVLTSSSAAQNAFLNDSGVLTNNGQVVVDVGAGGQRFLYGGIDNTVAGTVTINQATDSNNAGQWTNAGSITIAAGAALTHIGPLTTSGTLTIGSGASFSQTGNLSWPSGAITNNGSFTAYSGSFTTGTGSATGNPLVLLTKTISPNGSGAATLTVHGTSTLNTDLAAGYPLTLEGTAADGSVSLSYSADRTSNAPIHLTSTNAAFSAFLNGNSSVLTNNASLTVDAGAGGQRFLYGGVNNPAGHTVTVSAATDSNNAGQWTNAGSITIAAGAALTHIGPLTTSGTLTIGSGASFSQTGNLSWPSGAITNNGSFTAYSGSFTTGTGSATGNPLVLLTKTISPNGSGAATLTVHGTSTLNTDLAAGYPLTLEGTAADGSVSLSYSADRTSNAPIHLTSTNAAFSAFLNGNSSVLTNNASLTVDAGAGGQRFLYGGVNNPAGHTVTVSAATDSNNAGQWTNAGSITIAAGAALTHIGPLTTSGTLTIGSGASFSQTGNLSWPSGAITNNGSFTAYSGSFTTGTGSATGNPLVLLTKTISPNGSGAATLTVHGTSTLNTDLAAGYPLTLEGTAADGSVSLSYSADRTSNAPIHLTSTNAAFSAFLNGNSSVLTNNASLTVDAGAGGQRFLYGGVNNSATGTITVNRTVQGNNIAWTSAGKLTVAGGQTLQLATVSLTLNGGTLSGNGTVEANVTNVAANVTPGGSPGKLTISGSYTQQTKGKLTVDIKGASPGQFDVLAVTGAATLTGSLVLKPAPTFTGTVGQTFPVLTAGSYAGTFTKLTKAVIDPVAGTYYQPTYPGGAPTLLVTQATFSAPATGARGAQITVSGTGWIPGKKVTIALTDSLLVTTTLKSVTANGSGSFSTSVTIPAGAATGNATISAKGAITALTMTRTIAIT